MRFQILPCLFLITTVLSIFCTPVDSQCLEQQKTLLLQLKDNLKFNSSFSTKLVLWNHNTDCCEWGGVTCDDTGYGYVAGLDLSNESIYGGIINNSSSLFGLRHLQSLNLAYNDFNSWHISYGFEKLTSLTYLNLSNAGFSGQIPIGISRLTRLVSLDLSWNYFLELENSNLKLLVQNLTELTELRLDGVIISSKGEEWCEAISSSLPNLRVLSLSDCDLSGPLCSSLENLRSLSVIDLSGNNLTYLNLSYAGFTGQIPIGISRLTRLVSLDLSWNYFLELENSNLKLLVQNLTELTELRLDFVQISSKGEKWCEAISSSLPNLRVLSLSHCDLSGPLCSSLENLYSLSWINLGRNNFSAPLPNFFAKFPNLTKLLLYGSNLQGTFPENIFHIPTLRSLDLEDNELLEGSFPEFSQNGSLHTMILSNTNFSGRLPDSIGNLRMLSTIDVQYCSFTGPIPSSMANLTQLVYLDLSYNMFIGPIPSAEGLSNLGWIDLSHNSLSGSIPSSLFEHPSLVNIYLSFNQFDGQVDEFSNASSSRLQSIYLSNNNLQGSVPMSFFELGSLTQLAINSNNFSGPIQLEKFYSPPNLSFLDLSDNQIEGEIPNWFWEFGNGTFYYLNLSHNLLSNFKQPYVIHNFTVLDLHSNQLHGEIPIPRGSVEYLDLSSNSFISSIPPTIGNVLTDAHFFSLSNNSIIGNIPQSICKIGYLQVLDLSNNGLNGTIPSCLIQRSTSTLGVLNLRNNKLGGNVLNIFSNNCSLQTLDLNGNHLEGRVPKSLSNCRGMEVLNLGNNMISDKFPCFLENISSLHVLVLRSNRFQGDINCLGVKNESWWNLQIIDLAFNNFSGKLPSSSFSNFKSMMIDKVPKLNNSSYSFLHSEYYSSRVNVIYKGIERELVKILTIFKSIDFSNNTFEGKIPDTIGNLKSLVLLNLSHNALKGSIPTSLGNLNQLESLDLSHNMLTDMIPTQLASLTFLSVLNVSYNLLVGRIPTGFQFQTFSETSFQGNLGLCGFPLNTSCNDTDVARVSPPIFKDVRHSILETEVYLSAALGFIVGFGMIIWPLVFCQRWRQWYYKHMDRVFLRRIIQKGAYRNPIRRL